MAAHRKTSAGKPDQGKDNLAAYSSKRNFAHTSEPAAKTAKRRKVGLRFVVQKHDARRLHFDLRLELGGVLKSWAVTKGPSMKAGVRRLAVQTEDHPMAYRSWEGVIPKGEYGGGTMIVWDHGTWQPEGDAETAIGEGKLTFTLNGEHLKGEFSLVRMKNDSRPANWLLIKRNDEHALGKDNAEPAESITRSAISGRTNAALAAGKEPVRTSGKRNAAIASARELLAIAGARRSEIPSFVEPSLAQSVASPPQEGDWIHEIKHDGYRIEARLENGKAKLLTRKGLDWSKRFPTVVKALEAIPVKEAFLDGEIVAQDQSGHSAFSGLQSDLKAGRHDRMVYYAFDLLHCNGVDLRGAALRDRKTILQNLISRAPQSFALRFNDHLHEPGEEILVHACRLGLEGIVSKQAGLAYISGRGAHWVKSKCMLRQEFVMVGFLPATDMKNAVGSLVLGYYEDGKLVHAGRAGTGYANDVARSLFRSLSQIRGEKPAFRNAVSRLAQRGVVWVRPELVAEIEYRGRTADGLLRQAAFAGLREDKPAVEVVLEEKAEFVPQHAQAGKPAAFNFTHPERVLWHDVGITKQDLGDYYSRVAERMLPHVRGRVLSLLRCPGGTAEKCFFAKHAWLGLDKSVMLVDVGDEKPMTAISDLQGLLELVQMNVLEIHVWGSRIQTIERPDRIVFDLDPGEGVPFAAVCNAAQELRERLEALKLRSFLKTSGGKGLHVVVPVEAKAGWEEVKVFAKSMAQHMALDSPLSYVASMAKNRRRGRIFIDYLRNTRGATAVAPFSTRARAGAPVAAPLRWDELPGLLSANQFTVTNLPQRLVAEHDDPWVEMPKLKQKVPKIG